ncbi:AAA domain-containing protein [Chitinophaga sp. CB10]|uniref:AAA domain-containing protein n=1 Tax=Chitinophaga sp. CB10 TaxID=1891659 RepID=UPI0025BBED8E|nr:AAA domain-containing protein [Chitinophaga sp. CB10]
MDYFKKLQELLKTEREEDRKSYQALTESTSVQDRRAGGLAWYPIAIRGSEMGRGDYLTVEVERTTHHDIPHQLRSGVSAVLFSNHDRTRHQEEGVISWVGENRLKITLRTDELPDWADDGKLGIDLLFDDNSYDEMQAALRQAGALAEDNKSGRLVRVLTGQAAPNFRTDVAPVHIPSLNHSQNEAVNKILQACDVAVVHGPPGTGKTTTLVQAIKALLQQEKQQILVVAPSNAAVDLLSEKLAEQGLNVLRVGNPARVSDRLLSLTLDRKMQGHNSLKEVSRLRKQANEFRNMAHKYKRNFGKAEREQRKALFDEARKIIKEVENIEQYVIEDVVAKAQVITATPVGSNHYTVKNLKYRTVIIDEAGQALEPACWIPILKGEKVILAGDHCQLPPTIKSNEAAAAGLATTLLEKVVALYPEAVVLLEEQYRMHATIMGYSSNVFYNDRLRAHASVAAHLLYDNDTPLAFIDTAGCGFDEQSDGTSTTNPEEAAFLFRHLEIMANALAPHYTPENFPTVAIISPYRQQIEVLKEQLAHYPALQPYKDRISINTIDSFQGQERDMVYISMTRSNTENKIGFLSDIRRMNVAMTRARKKLVIIGDSATLSQLPFYADFIRYAEEQNSYQSAWEYAE